MSFGWKPTAVNVTLCVPGGSTSGSASGASPISLSPIDTCVPSGVIASDTMPTFIEKSSSLVCAFLRIDAFTPCAPATIFRCFIASGVIPALSSAIASW